VGLVGDRQPARPSRDLRFFDVVGETLPSIGLARAAARATNGWALDAVRTAGKAAAEQLESAVAPYARPLIEEHRAAAANSCSPRRRRTNW